ncbi:MAG: restriction endonuclease subunit R, partial [Egibacteraceae bacterium]
QVRETIRHHLDRELKLRVRGIKVLSLFFLDAVADYRIHQDDGSSRLGPVGELFEAELEEALSKPRYADLALGPVEELHDAYFSQDTKGRAKDSKGEGEGDRSTYEKIMQGKEQLLSDKESLRFIFTHSALREGWDNPNVFQVCTLTHARSAITRRQQIGRGLRLPVNQAGARVHEREVARLTVIANESYDAFARGLQVDYEQETGRVWGTVERTGFAHLLLVHADGETPREASTEQLGFERSASIWEALRTGGFLDPAGRLTAALDLTDESLKLPMPEGLERCEEGVIRVLERYDRPPVRNARERREVTFRKSVVLDSGFQAMWEQVAQRTRYRVRVDSERIVRDAVKQIDDMDGVPRPLVRADEVELEVTGAGITAGEVRGGKTSVASAPAVLPDILGRLQNETDLTRVTLARILRTCGRLGDFRANPHAFTVQVARVLRSVLGEELIEGIEYEQIDGSVWEMRQLEPEAGGEVERYIDRLYEIQHAGKSPFSHVEWESSVEERFAKRLDDDARVRFFVKLPGWFTVDTPVGPYNPDWAICWEDGEKPRLHLVRETKSTHEEIERRGTENAKIACAREHFKAIGTEYAVATSFDDLIGQMG